MCIRDRTTGAAAGGGPQELPVATGGPFEGLTGVPLGSRVPVSYTHLRAHETVLDIVCRLLLEKNKDNDLTDGAKAELHQAVCDSTRAD